MKKTIESKQEAPDKAAEEKQAKLVGDVKAALGDSLARLVSQPLGIANGGSEAILQRACKEAAGFPDPVAAAVAKVRVMCGSKGQARTKDSIFH